VPITTYDYDVEFDNITWERMFAEAARDEPTSSDTPYGIEELRFLPARWLPPEQEYYWTEEWQGGEQESLRELANGGAVQFDTAQDLLRWLFSADDD
jgi:hypothetical protein